MAVDRFGSYRYQREKTIAKYAVSTVVAPDVLEYAVSRPVALSSVKSPRSMATEKCELRFPTVEGTDTFLLGRCLIRYSEERRSLSACAAGCVLKKAGYPVVTEDDFMIALFENLAVGSRDRRPHRATEQESRARTWKIASCCRLAWVASDLGMIISRMGVGRLPLNGDHLGPPDKKGCSGEDIRTGRGSEKPDLVTDRSLAGYELLDATQSQCDVEFRRSVSLPDSSDGPQKRRSQWSNTHACLSRCAPG